MKGKKHIVHISAFVVSDDKFLIVKRNDDEIAHPGAWTLPGGKAEEEENVLQVLRREVLEEAGLEIQDRYEFLWDYAFRRPDGHTVKGFCFLVWPTTAEVTLGGTETEFVWITLEELDKYEFAEGVKEKIKKNAWKWEKRHWEDPHA